MLTKAKYWMVCVCDHSHCSRVCVAQFHRRWRAPSRGTARSHSGWRLRRWLATMRAVALSTFPCSLAVVRTARTWGPMTASWRRTPCVSRESACRRLLAWWKAAALSVGTVTRLCESGTWPLRHDRFPLSGRCWRGLDTVLRCVRYLMEPLSLLQHLVIWRNSF